MTDCVLWGDSCKWQIYLCYWQHCGSYILIYLELFSVGGLMSQIKFVHRLDINTAMCAMVISIFPKEIVGAGTTQPIYNCHHKVHVLFAIHVAG